MKKENLINIAEANSYPDVVKIVREKSREIEGQVIDVTSFEYDCYVDIGRNLLAKESHESVRGLAIYHTRRKAAKHLRRSKVTRPYYLEDLTYINGEGSEIDFEVPDVLANVEEMVLYDEEEKELITLLAKGDHRKELIITELLQGQTNDSELSDTLASVLGGKSDSHRRAITRFKKDCVLALAPAI